METVSIQTTQNIDISYTLAGVAQRIWAFLLDALVLFCFVLLLSLVSSQLNLTDGSELIFGVMVGLMVFLYFLLMEVFMEGQTIGKRGAKIKVVKLDGSKPSVGAYLLRWIMIPLDYFSMGGIAIVLILFTKKGQRLGDLLAGTTVVQVNKANPTLTQNKAVLNQIDENYEPQFPEAIRLSGRDIELIHQSILAFRQSSQRAPVELLKKKLEERLGVQSDLPPIKFLFTLAKDHTHLAGRD